MKTSRENKPEATISVGRKRRSTRGADAAGEAAPSFATGSAKETATADIADDAAGQPARPARRPSTTLIGWCEWVKLPDFGDVHIKTKIDTGARTSAIHAWNIELTGRRGRRQVAFEIHPLQRSGRQVVHCSAPLIDERTIRNSGGQAERRYIIAAKIELDGISWPIELSLTRRDEMGFRMLLGRTALRNRFLIDPGRSFVMGRYDPAQSDRPDAVTAPIRPIT